MRKKSPDRPLSPLEIALREIAAAAGVEGIIIVNLRPETYPATTHFTFLRFDVKGENMVLNILVKAVQQDPDLRTKFFVKEKFLNEVHFYSQCVPKIRPVLDKWKEEDPSKEVPVLVPTYYGHDLTECQEWLAIEDIGPEYIAFRDVENLDKSHLKEVPDVSLREAPENGVFSDNFPTYKTRYASDLIKMKLPASCNSIQRLAAILALASFHSASLAWKINNPAEFAAVARLFTETEMLRTDDDPAKDVKTQKINASLGAAARSCTTYLPAPYSVVAERIYNSAFIECPTWVSTERAEPWSVITHGDCWAKNFLFKYDRNKKITGVAMIDFKSARAASPVLDVTNFLLSSGSADCLKDLRPFIEKHKDSMAPKMTDYRHHVRLFGCYGVVAALVHHYYCVLCPNLDVEEATTMIIMLDDQRHPDDLLNEPSVGKTAPDRRLMEAAKKSTGQGSVSGPNFISTPRDGQPNPESPSSLRVALIVKAAHDVRLI